jgi:hypothetical protein
MASIRQFPPLLGRRAFDRIPAGLLLTAVVAIVLSAGFDLSSIASLGSAIALMVFGLVSAGHMRVRKETGANVFLLLAAVLTTVIVLITFVFTTLTNEPATAVTLVVIVALSVGVDFAWKSRRDRGGSLGDATLRTT